MIHELLLPVSDLLSLSEAGSETRSVEIPAGTYGSIRLPESMHASVILQTTGEEDVIATVRANGTIELICDRCLEPFRKLIQIQSTSHFAQHPDNEETRIIVRDTIDLLPTILEDIALAIPMKNVCRDDCSGIKITSQ